MLQTVEVPRHTVMPGLQPAFCLKMFMMLHIPEALRYTVMQGLQPG